MATSMRSSPKSGVAGCRAAIALLVVLTTLHQLTIVRGSSASNFVFASEGPANTTAAKLSSPSSIVDGTTAAGTSVKLSKSLSHSELDPDFLAPSLSSADRKEITDNRIRTKRNWKTSRVQAAWGKRADGDGGVDEHVLASVLRVPDTRLRRKWTQMGRQAWGKRSYDSTTTGRVSAEAAPVKTDRTDDEVDDDATMDDSLAAMNELIIPGRSTRKWGVGSAKAAWGKRKWGASNDMRVWGKRSVGDEHEVADGKDDSVELQGNSLSESRGRARRSAFDGESTRQRLSGDQWLQRAAVEAVAAKRLRMPGGTPAVLGAGRVYVGPKRNWQTNTMKVWGKRAYYDDDGNDDNVGFSEYAVDDADDEHKDDDLPNVWNGIDEDQEASSKRAWSSDNSLRIWGKRYRSAERPSLPFGVQVAEVGVAY